VRALLLAFASALLASPPSSAGEDLDKGIFVTGSVTDGMGRGVSGATVFVSRWWRPVVTDVKNTRSKYLLVKTDSVGRFSILKSEGLKELLGGDDARIWASDGQRLSHARSLDRASKEAAAYELRLEERVEFCLRVKSADGLPVEHGQIDVHLVDVRARPGDALGSGYSFGGRTNKSGEYRTRELPEAEFGDAEVTVGVRRSEFVFKGDQIRQTRAGRELLYEVQLPPVIRVTGRIVNPEGRRAEGVLVTAHWRGRSTSNKERYDSLDGSGFFSLSDVIADKSWVLVVASDFKAGIVAQVLAAVRVPRAADGVIDLGEIWLPKRRSVVLHVVDERGRALRGSLLVERADVSLGATSEAMDENGTVTLQWMPAGIGHVAEIRVEHPRHGLVVTKVDLPGDTDDQTIVIRGGGMLIVRFIDSLGLSASVVDPEVFWDGSRKRREAKRGKQTEMRIPIDAGSSGTVEVSGEGIRPARVEGVRMLPDEPTVVNVRVVAR